MSQTLERSRYEWNTVNWRQVEIRVFKLQRRIYQAASRKDVRLVHRLQRLLSRSWYGRLLAVRRVSQDNQGKRTAGIDGVAKLTGPQRWALANRLSLTANAQAVRRIWIDKRNGTEQRPLGIPVMGDRAGQALVKLALEPEWEAYFEPNSYGFRPGRSVHDAIDALFKAIAQQPKYVLDADIAQCFERINHSALIQKLNAPAWLRRPIQGWLNAGVWDQGNWFARTQGTPQGGVLSPLLANIALHGMEHDLQTLVQPRSYLLNGVRRRAVPLRVIRYADDFVVLHPDLATLQAARTALEHWLKPLGLELHPRKTQIVHTLGASSVPTGFDFLGFRIRQFSGSPRRWRGGFKTIIQPSPEACRRHRQQLRQIVRAHRGDTQRLLIRRLNTSIRGWRQFYRTVCSRDCFSSLDDYLYRLLMRWTQRQKHDGSSHRQVAHYWGVDRGLGWVFCTRDGLALAQHQKVRCQRHIKVRGIKSPYDGDWLYWAARWGRYPGLSSKLALLLKRQLGCCAQCGLVFTWSSLLEVHHINGCHQDDRLDNLQVLHRHCHDQAHGAVRLRSFRTNDNDSPAEEPCEVKVSRTVLKPSGGGNPFA